MSDGTSSFRPLVPVLVEPDGVPGLDAALDGSGPALLPLPAGPEGERLAAALLPLAADGVPATTAVVVATSGSTGAPRGVRISAAALEQSAALTHRVLGGPGQWLLAMSPARIAGLTVLVRSRTADRPPVNLPPGRFDPDAFAAAAARMDPDVPHYVSLVPTQVLRLLRAGVALDGFAAILVGGGPIPEGLPERAARAGGTVVRTYGMTETCGGCVYDGLPLPGVRVAIGAGGLVRVTGPVLAQGYLGPPPQAGRPSDGSPSGQSSGPPGSQPGFNGAWFVSSDLGRIDGGGVLHVLGRADDVILTGGVNVPAQSVEAVLAGQQSVAEAVVVGVDDPEWGQRVVAVLVAGETAPDLDALRALVAKRLGPPHAPKQFLVVDGLPRLPSGKVDRAAVRALPFNSPAPP